MRAILSERVLVGDHFEALAVIVDEASGKIVDLRRSTPGDMPVEDLGAVPLLPGGVDTHVHINEPGRTEWEGFETATRAAASGGVTTLVDMPLNSSPVTTSGAAFDAKVAALNAAPLRADIGLYAGVVPGNAGALEQLAARGVLGAKAFLVHSGIDDFPNVTRADLDVAMPILTRLGLPLLVHSELDLADSGRVSGDPTAYATWLGSRPEAMEVAAIEMLLELCAAHGTALHIVHLAAEAGIEPLQQARERGLPVTAETCPQYLAIAAEDVPQGSTAFKCAPPIRGRAVQEALWAALDAGTIDFVATDHSPAPPAIKHLDDGDFMAAWGGIAQLGLALPVVFGEAVRRFGDTPETLARVAWWLSTAPTALVGLDNIKGRIEIGWDADLCAFDPTVSWTVTESDLHYRHRISPWLGRTVRGRVRRTWLRGQCVWDGDQGFAAAPGQLVVRPPA